MFGFLSGIQAKFIAAIVVILLVVAAWFYVKHLQSSLDAAQSKLARMEDVVNSQKLAITNLNNDIIRMNKVQNDYSEKAKEIDKSYDRLEDTFNQTKSGKPRDFNKIVNKKPDLMEKKMNRATKDSLRCNEIVTGSPLTFAEKSGKVKNTVCPELLKVK